MKQRYKMAARAGPRAEGTDGSDFNHREKVASHYQESVTVKVKIRKSLIPHMFLTVLGFGRLLSIALGIKFFNPPEVWELVWLLSGLCAYIGYGSLSKNHSGQLMAYLVGNIVFGISMLVYGAWSIIDKSLSLFKKGNSFNQWKSAPTKVALIAVCFQVQLLGLYYGFKLYRAWGNKGRKDR